MKKYKEFYQSKNGKAILFFGFYLIFFIILALIFQNYQKENNELKEDIENVSVITTIKNLYEKDFTYHFEINDNGNIVTFNGSKEKVDYNDYEYKYFLDYININQLIKKSKVTGAGQTFTFYEIDNQSLNELLNTSEGEGTNKISELYGTFSNKNEGEYSVTLDLKEYMNKENFIIKLNYKVGDKS